MKTSGLCIDDLNKGIVTSACREIQHTSGSLRLRYNNNSRIRKVTLREALNISSLRQRRHSASASTHKACGSLTVAGISRSLAASADGQAADAVL